MQRIGVLIAAAGMSSRMGSFKPLLSLGNETLLSCQLNKFIELGLSPIVVITGNNANQLEDYIDGYRKRKDIKSEIVCIRNNNYQSSEMFDTIKIGLNWLKGKCDRFFILPADIPMFSTETVKKMLKEPAKICKPLFQGQGGHPLLVQADLIDKILDYTGENGLKGALREMQVKVYGLPVTDVGILLDADTIDDYQKIKEYAKQKQIL